MIKRQIGILGLFLCGVCWVSAGYAEVRVPRIFGSNMVLQQDKAVPVWGWADPDEKVTVTVGGQSKSVTADAQGKWRVTLDPMKPGTALVLKIEGKDSSVICTNVLVGEVWICSGQSNMYFPLKSSKDASQEIGLADLPEVRLFSVQRVEALVEQEDFHGEWRVCSPTTVSDFSAVGYYFGTALHRQFKWPVGLIMSSVGGTAAESWTAGKAAAEAFPEQIEASLKKQKEWEASGAAKAAEQYQVDLEKWRIENEKAKQEGRASPKRPPRPAAAAKGFSRPSGLYNAMIAPMKTFAIRGALWYQGEANAGRAQQYYGTLPALIRGWREAWGQGDFPFLVVQLANYRATSDDPNVNSSWAIVRDAQKSALKLPATGLAVAIDVGEAGNIHPKDKKTVGERLALAARKVAYGENIVASGPMADYAEADGKGLRVHFTSVGGGLVARGGALRCFAVAGEDGTFAWAKAEIDGDTLVVRSPEVPQPVSVRYAWEDNPEGCNLYNKEGLPASPFSLTK